MGDEWPTASWCDSTGEWWGQEWCPSVFATPMCPTTPKCLFGERIYTEVLGWTQIWNDRCPYNKLDLETDTAPRGHKILPCSLVGRKGREEGEREAQLLPCLWSSNLENCGWCIPASQSTPPLWYFVARTNKVSPACPTSLSPKTWWCTILSPLDWRWNPAGS